MDGVSFNNSMEDSLGSPSAGHASSSTAVSSREKTKRPKVKSNQQVYMCSCMYRYIHLTSSVKWMCLAYHCWLTFRLFWH